MGILEVLVILSTYSVVLIIGVRWLIAGQMGKIKINRIHDFIQSKINDLEANLSGKFDQADEVSINLRVDLQHYQRLKEDFDVFSDQVQVKKSSMEDVFKRQSKLFEKGENEAGKFEKILSNIQLLDKEIKKNVQDINTREKKVSQVIERINTWEATLYQQLQEKVDKFAKHYDEIMDGRINSLQKWLDGSEQKINGLNKKFVDLGEMHYLSLKERYDDIEVEIKDRLDDISREEKLKLEEDLKLVSGEMRTKLQTFNADLSREQDKQQDLIDQKVLIEQDLVNHKETLKAKMDDLAETILSGFKGKIGDYQSEIVEELEKKFNTLDGQIQNWDNYLQKKESEIVDKIDLKFTSITDSFDSYRTVVDEESQKLVLTQQNLEKQFVQIHEEKLSELLFKIDTMKEAMQIIEAKNEERGVALNNLYSFLDESKEMVTYKLDNFVTHLNTNKDESGSIIQAYAEGLEKEKVSMKAEFKDLFEKEFMSNIEKINQEHERRYNQILNEIILKSQKEADEKVIELEASLKVEEVSRDKLTSEFEERIKEVEIKVIDGFREEVNNKETVILEEVGKKIETVINQIEELEHIDVDDIVNAKVSDKVEEKVQAEIDERFSTEIEDMMNLTREEIKTLKKENASIVAEMQGSLKDGVLASVSLNQNFEDKVKETEEKLIKEFKKNIAEREKTIISEVENNYQHQTEKVEKQLTESNEIELDFKTFMKRTKEGMGEVSKRLKEEEALTLEKKTKLEELEASQEIAFERLEELHKKLDTEWVEVNKVGKQWERLNVVLDEIEEKHLLQTQEHLEKLTLKSEEDYQIFLASLEEKEKHILQNSKASNEINSATNSKLIITASNTGNQKSQLTALNLKQLKDEYRLEFQSFIDNLKQEKKDDFNLIEQIVAEFQDKVMLKKNQVDVLEEKENEYLNLIKKRKANLVDQSKKFYLSLEKETENKAQLYLNALNERLSNEMEIKKQDWEILLVEYLESQKAGLKEYQLLIQNELKESLGTQLEQIQESINTSYDEMRSQIHNDLERDGAFLKKELLELERHLKQHDNVVKDLDKRNENFRSLEHQQQDYLDKTQSLIKENQERFKKYFNEKGFSNKFLKELKKDFSVDFLKKELSKEFDSYRKDLIKYTEKWEKLSKELEEGKHTIKTVAVEGEAEFKQLIKKSQHQMIDQENKTRAKFNETVKFIESEMKGIAGQIKQLFEKSETIEKMYMLQQDFESSVEKYEGYLGSFKKYETDFEKLQLEIEEIKSQDHQLKGLYQELEQKEIMVGQVEKKLVQIIDLSIEADKRLNRIESTSNGLATLADSIDNYHSDLSEAQSQMNKVVAFKNNFIEIKALIDTLEQNVVVAKDQNEILVEKINTETNQQDILGERLNQLEDKSILLENKYKVMDDFSDKFDQLDIAILDIEERIKSIDKLKKDLTSEQSKMMELRDMFNNQIGLSLNLAKDKNDQKLVSQYPKIVKTLKGLGWTEIQISKHLDLDLAQIKLILKK